MQRWHVIVIYETLGGRASSWSGIVPAEDWETAYELGCDRARNSRPRLARIRGGDVRKEGEPPTSWAMTHPVLTEN